ncbi:hypothetical protein CPHO_09690 [Corynebacterium phocae]|uniref:Uncharacterized protein n=1 Tax=Corynebacterium phocae TaxID=161895 RepID=A0A1L7D4K8_9CORY|nr:hypothetical protein [Corynebacterium phocae]APT93116.1 hypothetical protein CPHO_09690 [Corynebacterium phocae]KAA8722190.1 hypothetical protein F4V58_09165 [Corynebacterium phocae]
MEILSAKLAPQQDKHAEKIAAYAKRASKAFEDFDATFVPAFQSTEKPWSIPWLNDFGTYVADNPEAHSNRQLEYVLGQALVTHYQAVWGIHRGRMGVFAAEGQLFQPVASNVRLLKAGWGPYFGQDWVYPTAGSNSGPQLFPDLGQPGREGFTSPGQYTVGMYRNLLFDAALRTAFADPATRIRDLIQLAALDVAQRDPEVAVELYNRAVELGMEPIEELVNRTLEQHGRIPLV